MRSSSGLIDLLSPQPMHPCSLMQASTKMPTSLVVAAEERCWPPPLDGVSHRSQCGAVEMQPRRLTRGASRPVTDAGRCPHSPGNGPRRLRRPFLQSWSTERERA